MESTILVGLTEEFVMNRYVGRLATVDAHGVPQIIPVCYAWDGAGLWIPLDAKPKRFDDVMRLKRVRNIQANPHVALVIDDYLNAAWDQLAYVLIEGYASIIEPGIGGHGSAVMLLRSRYPQYVEMPIESSPAIMIEPTRVASWGEIDSRVSRPATLESTISGRRTVRRFKSTPVAPRKIERILDVARWAPSPHGSQPWRFAVLTQQTGKTRLADAMGENWEAILAQDGESPAIVAQRVANSRERILTAPVIIVPCLYLEDLDNYPDPDRQVLEREMAIQSVGAAIQNMLLVAYYEGLDMGWMCAPLFCQPVVRAALDLPPTWHPQALLPVGYAAADPRRRPRRPLDEMVRWDAL
jgi:coenzyme F420-0:L-glutamate ligase / coenzyme F420-1:gamma-L-glutamate ligase